MLRRMQHILLTAAVLASSIPAMAAEQAPKPSGLPEGPGKENVEAVCLACHQTREIQNSAGYTREGWKELFSTMIDLSAAPEVQDRVTQYLATNFPPNQKRTPKLIAGNVKVTFKEWQTPTLGQRSRDPIQAADGTIWWAGQWSNTIGRINPMTGEQREYPLPPKAMPHTVTLDAKGNVWYTGNMNATLGYLDPRTGKVTEFKVPDPQAKDPHSAIFDAKGILWFTMQVSNRVGRFDPASGEFKIVEMSVPNSRPYGIKLGPDGAPWFACNGRGCVVRIDPATMALKEVKVPGEKATVRRLDFDAEGNLWYVNSGEGRLGRYNLKSGEIKEWPSPSGPRSHPYAIVVAADGAVWYNESFQRPDALVRFDPKTETFQSWAIPSGGVHAGIIRHMRRTKDGELVIHQSSTNRIILVTPTKS